ncbi:MAG: hypothetical protein AAF296_03880 [Pseudomonadota bacterium]
MDNFDVDINRLKLAEHQFRLACTVNLAVATETQSLDVPVKWTFGKHTTTWDEFGLRSDQAEDAALYMERSATFILASVIRDLLVIKFKDPKNHNKAHVRNAYQISRLIRNAFAHSSIEPHWSIDKDCRDKQFEIPDIIKIDTSTLHNRPLMWPDYGGPLAIFRFGRFVRVDLLDDPINPNRPLPDFPRSEIFQQGRLIAKKVDEIPEGAEILKSMGPGERLHLGGGHYLIRPSEGS